MSAESPARAGLEGSEEVVLGELGEAAAGRAKRARVAEGTAIVSPVAKRFGVTPPDVEKMFLYHAALEVKDVRATRLFGFFKLTRPARGIGLRTREGAVRALEKGAAIPASTALAAYCAASLAADDAATQEPPDFEGSFPAALASHRNLGALGIGGGKAEAAGGEGAGGEAARNKSLLARLRRAAPGGGFELGERARVSSPAAALEALLQSTPEEVARVLSAERFEAWIRDDCKERELADLVTATRLRAAADRMSADKTKALFVRLLAYSPLRDAVALSVVPSFVAKLTSAPEAEVEQMVAALEGLGTEGVLESLIKAVYEVPAEARPRVLMAMGAVGSPRVIEPLTRLALHSNIKADRLEAAAAVLRIAGRQKGEAAEAARAALAASEDAEVRAMLGRVGNP